MTKEWEQAIQRGDCEAPGRLIEGGADINSKDQHGQTGLMVAAMRGHTELVRLLVERGADLDVTAKYNLSALMLAVINGHVEIVRILADASADTTIRGSGAPGFHGKTALNLAEGAGRDEAAAILRAASRPT
jgi:ankyrin repeat protein